MGNVMHMRMYKNKETRYGEQSKGSSFNDKRQNRTSNYNVSEGPKDGEAMCAYATLMKLEQKG